MSFFLLIFKSAFRNRLRTTLTSLGVAIAIIAFLVLRTIISAWHAGVENSASDRMFTRNKISITFELPLSYVDKVKRIVADKGAVAYENWFGAVYPKDEHAFFANFAADPDVFKLYPEMVVPPEQMQSYLQDRQGAIVGAMLAEKYGWKVGDKITLRGTIYAGDWDFNIRGIFHTASKGVPESQMYFHWKYFNEKLPEGRKDHVGLIMTKVNDGSQGAAVAQAIDKEFASSPAETRTESEKQFQLEFLSMASAILTAIQLVSFVVLAILMLILANTMAMATRERTGEYAVMRAIGFQPRHIVGMVLGEGFIIALVGAALGVTLAKPLLGFFKQLMERQMGGMFESFDLEWPAVALAVSMSMALGMIASALPAVRAGRLKIVDALRRVE
ncbi:MAG: FtsX-like permease family protein [Myxococcales bacterium]|nr:FtsX-like permease family protein [Myxococcales bacterium]